MTVDPDPGPGPQVVLRQEHLQVATARQPVERLIVRRVVTSEVRQVDVTVRREEVHLERRPFDGTPAAGDDRGTPTASPDPAGPVLVVVLSEEEPVVRLRTRPYERVSVYLDTVTDQEQVSAELSREQADVVTEATGPDQTAR